MQSFLSVTPSRHRRARDRLRHPAAALITHGCLVVLIAAEFALLLNTPVWVAALPCLLLHHRIGVLAHEYIHGIPFRRRRGNLLVIGVLEPIAQTFGLLELFRGTHLAHHRWLNTERDPAFQTAQRSRTTGGAFLGLSQLEIVQHFHYLADILRHGHPIARRSRIMRGFFLSLAAVVFWVAIGHAEIVLYLAALNLYTGMVSSSLRGAVEHHGPPGERRSTNEYRAFIPLFNLNRHVHHHIDPRCPWYLLEFQSTPLPARTFVTHWVHVYLKRDYTLLPPEPRGAAPDGGEVGTALHGV
jgi:fatty acid desaturase